MVAGTKRPNLQTGAARRHSLNRKIVRPSLLQMRPAEAHGLRPARFGPLYG